MPRKKVPAERGQGIKPELTGCGCLILAGAGGLGLFIGWDYLDRMKYDRVSARVHSVSATCLLEWEPPRDPAWWESSNRRHSPEMPCAEAQRQLPGSDARLIEMLDVTYTYRSPRNGHTYQGRLHREKVDFPPDVRPGGEMPVYSLKSEPGRSRGIYQWPVD